MRQTQQPSPPSIKPSSVLLAQSLNLPRQCQQLFRQLSVPAQKVSELSSGIKLANIVNKIFFDGANASLNSKIKLDNQSRKGNNVVNVNLVLKEIRQNKKVEWPQQFMHMTTFKLLDSEEQMLKLVNWITESYSKIQCGDENEIKNIIDKRLMVQSGNFQTNSKNRTKQNTVLTNPQNQTLETKQIKHHKINGKTAKAIINSTRIRAALKTHQDMDKNMNHPAEHEYDLGYQNSHEYSPTPTKEEKGINVDSPSPNKKRLSVQSQENAFENIYFCDRDISPDRLNLQNVDDSLDKSEKVSKKGSFKVVRPKSSFDDRNGQGSNQKNSETDKSQDINSPQKNEPQLRDGKHNKTENNFNSKFLTDQKQSSARKTVVRMLDRPPIYKKLAKDEIKTQVQQKHSQNSSHMTYSFVPPQPFSTTASASEAMGESRVRYTQMISKRPVSDKRRGQKQNSNNSINTSMPFTIKYNSEVITPGRKQTHNQIALSNESSIDTKMTHLKQKHLQPEASAHVDPKASSRSRNKRNIFKIQIKEVAEQERKQIMQWLISINLLTADAVTYYQHFHQICSSGIIFPELVNHHLGRGDKLYYNKNPQRNSQIHANYQRVFDYLKDLPHFQSELMYMYDYFVPEALESPFWSFMKSFRVCFHKIGPNSRNKSFSRDSAIKEQLIKKSENEQVSQKQKGQNISVNQKNMNKYPFHGPEDYQKIKYGSSNKFKKSMHTPEHRNQTPTKKSRKHGHQQQSNEPRRKTSLEFIKQLPQKSIKYKHQQLVQVEQPVECEPNKSAQGYRELYENRKNHNSSSLLQTPQKKNQNSASRSRIISSSIKKVQQKPQLPSVSLEMQKKSIDYLTEKEYERYELTMNLFDHEMRNGVLLNKIIMDESKTSHRYVAKPKSMLDCKQNFANAFERLRLLNVNFPAGYEYHFEQIIKGKLSMFYGIVYYIITANEGRQTSQLQKGHIKQISLTNVAKTTGQFPNEQQSLEEVLFWIRELQQTQPEIASLQIRDFNTLVANVLCHNLLYKLAALVNSSQYAIKPNYLSPINSIEQLSNIRKILSYFVHNQIIRAQNIPKAKSIVSKDRTVIINVMKELMSHMKLVNKIASDRRIESNPTIISFSKYARQGSSDDIKKPESNNERLETTMANNSFTNQILKQQGKIRKPERKPLEVPWMRRLGFSQDLSLNNGVILCHLVQKLTMQNVIFNQNPTSKAECLTNIRRALKLIDKFNWDEYDVVDADDDKAMEIYKFLKEKYRHSYSLKNAG